MSLIYSVECTFKEFHHLLSELNRCHLDLSELNRLIQSLQTLETSQTVTNGDIRRIISIQVGLAVQSGAANLTSVKQHHVKVKLFYGNFLFFFCVQNLSLEKPKKPRSGKMWGHSRTLSRVEALGMVRMVRHLPFHHFSIYF